MGYDAAGRLLTVDQLQPTEARLESYTYDANGNRLTDAQMTDPATIDAQDRLLAYGADQFTYSRGGRLVGATRDGQAWTYGYDLLGNLRSATGPGVDVRYTTDGGERRVVKRVGGNVARKLLYGAVGRGPVAELDGNDRITKRFIYGQRSDVPELVIRDGVTYRLLQDHLGSVRRVVRLSDGVVVRSVDYDAFGKVTRESAQPGALEVPFGFAGGLEDRETGLVRFGARDYDPRVGRWTSKDESGFGGGLNFYAYANDDPVNYIDVDGRLPIIVPIIIFTVFVLEMGAAAPSDTKDAPADVGAMAGAVVGLKGLPTGVMCGGIASRGAANAGAAFADLEIPMTQRAVRRYAARGEVGLDGVKVSINTDATMLGTGRFGEARPGRITLFSDAFRDAETLVKTLGHERMHIHQFRHFGAPATEAELWANEAAAYTTEHQWWDFFNGAQ